MNAWCLSRPRPVFVLPSNAVVTCELKYNCFKIISAFVDGHRSIMLHLRALYSHVSYSVPQCTLNINTSM